MYTITPRQSLCRLFIFLLLATQLVHCGDPRSRQPFTQKGVSALESITDDAYSDNALLQSYLNAACAKLSTVIFDEPSIARELTYFCEGQTAAPRLPVMAANAWLGEGEPTQFAPINLVSHGNRTELFVAGAIKFPKTVAQIIAKRRQTLTFSVRGNGVTVNSQILGEMAGANAAMQNCLKLKTNVRTSIFLFTHNDEMVLRDCLITLADNPPASLSFHTLIPDSSHPENDTFNNLVTLLVGTDGAETYGFFLSHMKLDNKRMAVIAEDKIKSQLPAFAKAYYKVVTEN